MYMYMTYVLYDYQGGKLAQANKHSINTYSLKFTTASYQNLQSIHCPCLSRSHQWSIEVDDWGDLQLDGPCLQAPSVQFAKLGRPCMTCGCTSSTRTGAWDASDKQSLGLQRQKQYAPKKQMCESPNLESQNQFIQEPNKPNQYNKIATCFGRCQKYGCWVATWISGLL